MNENTDSEQIEIEVGDLVIIKPYLNVMLREDNSRFREQGNIGVVEGVVGTVGLLRVSFHDNGVEYTNHLYAEWLEYAAIEVMTQHEMLVDVDEIMVVQELPPDYPDYEQGFSTHSDDTPTERLTSFFGEAMPIPAAAQEVEEEIPDAEFKPQSPKLCRCCKSRMSFHWLDNFGHLYICHKCQVTEFDNCTFAAPPAAPDALEVRLAALIKRLEARVDELEAALTPFAQAAEDASVQQAGKDFVLHIRHETEAKFLPIYINGNKREWKFLDVSYLRAARKVLRGKSK